MVLKSTIGVIALSARRYIDWFAAIHRFINSFTLCYTLTLERF